MSDQHVNSDPLFSPSMSRKEAAAFLGLSPKTLANWKTLEQGPQPFKIGNRTRYLRDEIEAFHNELVKRGGSQ